MASEVEVLRHRDIGELTAAERHRLGALFASLRPRHPVRRTSRHERWHRGSRRRVPDPAGDACAGWASRPTSGGGGAGTSRGGWCC